jgi:hypothetical protein
MPEVALPLVPSNSRTQVHTPSRYLKIKTEASASAPLCHPAFVPCAAAFLTRARVAKSPLSRRVAVP